MALDERQLAVILQASIEYASQLLEESGGFLPFGTRARPDGEVEFVQPAPKAEDETLESIQRRVGAMLADDARREDILGAALVANAGLPDGGEFPTAIVVQIETTGFCRSIVVPYRLAEGAVELGKMIPGEAAPAVFAA